MSLAAALLGGQSIVDSIGQAPPDYPKRNYDWYADRAIRRTSRRPPSVGRSAR